MTDSVKKTKSNLPGAGPGRPKGVPNKVTIEVKQMILDALAGAGGIEYLIRQADEKPAAFLALVGKVLPLQVTGADGGAIETVTRIELVPMRRN